VAESIGLTYFTVMLVGNGKADVAAIWGVVIDDFRFFQDINGGAFVAA